MEVVNRLAIRSRASNDARDPREITLDLLLKSLSLIWEVEWDVSFKQRVSA